VSLFKFIAQVCFWFWLFGVSFADTEPVIFENQITVPDVFLTEGYAGLSFGGDIRIGDLTGNDEIDFFVYCLSFD